MTRVDGGLKVTGKEPATPPTTRCPTSFTPSLVCSTVACGTVDRIDSRRGATSTGCAAGAHRLQRRRSCPTTSAGVVLRPARRDRRRRPSRPPAHGASLVERALHGRRSSERTSTRRRRSTEARHAEPRTTRAATPTLHCAPPPSSTRLRYSIERNNHNPMETARRPSPAGTATRLTVWDKVQSISVGAAGAYAKAHGVPIDNVRVISCSSEARSAARAALAASTARVLRRRADAPPGQTGADPKADATPASVPADQPSADGHRRRPSGRISTIVHEGRTETAAVQPHTRTVMTGARSSCTPARTCGRPTAWCRLTSICRPTMRGPGATTGRSHSSRRWTIWPTARNGSDRTAAAQRTRARSNRRAAVLHPAAHRVPHAGRRDVRVVAAQPDAAVGARRRPARRIGMAAAGYHTIAQRLAMRSPG